MTEKQIKITPSGKNTWGTSAQATGRPPASPLGVIYN